jgi:hypothetical protein
MSGPPPKPAHLRARTNRKAGAAVLETIEDLDIPEIPNPDGRVWHELTVKSWREAWESPMASQWPNSDVNPLGRLALLWDDFYKKPGGSVLAAEIRLQEQRFGLTPLDRSRLQWEVLRTEAAEHQQQRRQPFKRPDVDPRTALMAVK